MAPFRWAKGSYASFRKRGVPYIPQYAMILIMGTVPKGPLILENRHVGSKAKGVTSDLLKASLVESLNRPPDNVGFGVLGLRV